VQPDEVVGMVVQQAEKLAGILSGAVGARTFTLCGVGIGTRH
jgi:biotin-(acetyl-CoA carboxylase) ligase